MEKEDTVRFAANCIAAMIQRSAEDGSLGVSPDGKVTLPLQPFGLASVRFPLNFNIRCPACWSGWIQPVEKKSPFSFFTHIFSESGSVKLTGLHCESPSCVLHKQSVPMAMVMEVISTKSFTVESRLLALLEETRKRGEINDKKHHLQLASDLSIGTEYQSIIQAASAEALEIVPPVTQDQWHRLDELVDSAALKIVRGGGSK